MSGVTLTIQAFSLAQHILDVLCHDGVDLCQVIIELVNVALGPCVCILLLCSLDEGVCMQGRARISASCAKQPACFTLWLARILAYTAALDDAQPGVCQIGVYQI